MSLARDLAEFLAPLGYDDLPAQAIDYAAMLIASTHRQRRLRHGHRISAQIIRDLARERGGDAAGLAVVRRRRRDCRSPRRRRSTR